MSNNNVIGIDVSKQTLSIFDPNSSSAFSVSNTKEGIEQFLAHVDDSSTIVYEPTGIYSSQLQMSCNSLAKSHRMIHCNDAFHLSKTLHFRNKNDELDASSLSMLGSLLQSQAESGHKNKLIIPSSNSNQELKTLFSHTVTLKKKLKKDKQHLNTLHNDAFSNQKMLDHTDASMQLIQQQLKETQDDIIAKFNELGYFDNFQLLQTIPGVGAETAITLTIFFQDLTEKGFTLDDSKKVVAYSGLDPTQKQSGTSISSSSLSKKGNKFVRSALYMASLQRAKHILDDPYMSTLLGKFASRMKIRFKSGKSKRGKSMICAIARKLLVVSWAIYNSGKAYDFR